RGIRPFRQAPRGMLVEVQLELVGVGGRAVAAGLGLAGRLAIAAAAAAAATAAALAAPARALGLPPDQLGLVRELAGTGLDVALQQCFGLGIRPFRLGGEDVVAEGGLARLQPLAAGDVAGLAGAVVGLRPLAVAGPLAFPLPLAITVAEGFR